MSRFNVAELRRSRADVLNRAENRGERMVIHRRGKDAAAIISMEDLELLERLIEEAEDRLDVSAARDALAESDDRVPYAELRMRLGQDNAQEERRPNRNARATKFEIQFTRTAERSLLDLEKGFLCRIDAAIQGLAIAPHTPGSKGIHGPKFRSVNARSTV